MNRRKQTLKMEDTKRFNTLFLDRDGVINHQRRGDYVKTIEEFVFHDGALEALRILSSCFKHILIVTNQRGVGRGLMDMEALDDIHAFMLQIVTEHEGRIDRIYTCTDIESNSFNRKPQPGMALQARQDFPDIDFSHSLMAGDSLSDMEFANNAGIKAVLIGNKYSPAEISLYEIYARYPDLLTFAREINPDGAV